MRALWQRGVTSPSRSAGPGQSSLPVLIAVHDSGEPWVSVPSQRHLDVPTVHTTGLGLPLSRALAVAGGGWVGLENLVTAPVGAMSLLPVVTGRHSADTVVPMVPSPSPAATQFWCVLETPPHPQSVSVQMIEEPAWGSFGRRHTVR